MQWLTSTNERSSRLLMPKEDRNGNTESTLRSSGPVLAICVLVAAFTATSNSLNAAPPRINEINFDDIKFEMKKGEPFKPTMLTKKIEALNGQQVRIRGYLLPSFQQRGITQFVLVRDNMECCFGPGAALFDCILVEMVEGKSTSFTVRPVSVEGVFNIKPYLGPDGKHLAIYHLDGHDVR